MMNSQYVHTGGERNKGNRQFIPEIRLLICCARGVVSDSIRKEIVEILSLRLDWERLYQLSIQHRLAPLMYKHFEQIGPDHLPSDIWSRFESFYINNSHRGFLVARQLLQLMESFEDVGISVIPFKGPVLSEWLYGDLAYRVYSDLDLLISQKDADRAVHLLEQKGWKEQFGLSSSQKRLGLKLLNCLAFDHPNALSVDLQWCLVKEWGDQSFGYSEIAPTAEKIDFFDTPIPHFSVEHLFFFLCFHGTKHQWDSLDHLCSLHEILIRHPNMDWALIRELAAKYRMKRLVALSLLLIEHIYQDGPYGINVYLDRASSRCVSALADRVLYKRFIQTDNGGIDKWEFDLRENWKDKLRHYFFPVYGVQIPDIEYIVLPESLAFLYFFIRPVRLLMRKRPT